MDLRKKIPIIILIFFILIQFSVFLSKKYIVIKITSYNRDFLYKAGKFYNNFENEPDFNNQKNDALIIFNEINVDGSSDKIIKKIKKTNDLNALQKVCIDGQFEILDYTSNNFDELKKIEIIFKLTLYFLTSLNIVLLIYIIIYRFKRLSKKLSKTYIDTDFTFKNKKYKKLNLLINKISEGFKPYKFEFFEDVILNNINFKYIAASPVKFGDMNMPLDYTGLGKYITTELMNENFISGRYICCLINLIDNQVDHNNFKLFLKNVRKSLTKEYSKLRFIGTFLIFYSNQELYDNYININKKGKFVDKTGLHKNVLMSSTFINIENNKYNTFITWGLAFAKYFYDFIVDTLNHCDFIKE